MKKVEIEFETAFESSMPIPKPLGRLYIGDHICRMYFTPEGKMKMYVPTEAMEDGSIELLPKIDPSAVFGFLPTKGD